MRNSSDIFCLKEPKTGENDGSRIFSVNGSCFSKINRRQHTSSDVFQFGCPKETQQDFQIPETSEIHEIPESSAQSENFEVPEMIDPVEKPKIASVDIPLEKGSGEPVVSSSSMRRNPLTGVGVEDDEKRSTRRRRDLRAGKWLW
ncbi:hypothetical protein MTP99_001212 [Tenebrio molitor]|jgi:hypothetical protein|uniref:Uncharacterized protein n=1 Tax=Tenebrio molitor TaxID=7067 RepID=A0A8J6L9S0_TENMO|nr:hypothetical protein GEV33_011510 [Tenebrio molitor]KAJ3637780.1 hypothetical protein MTP99_001212 [Tenebrio molitor]CAH1364870.1 unnamed protein product [Tenebrio molitor]